MSVHFVGVIFLSLSNGDLLSLGFAAMRCQTHCSIAEATALVSRNAK